MAPNVHHAAARRLRLLTPLEVATLLKISHKTLERWRADADGPPYHIIGRRNIRYDPADLEAWIKSGRRLDSAVSAEGAS